MTLSKAPGPWRWEQRESGWWRIHDELGIQDGPHNDAWKERTEVTDEVWAARREFEATMSEAWDANPQLTAAATAALLRADGERPLPVVLSAEHWSWIIDALNTALGVGSLSYEQRYGGSHLRDGLASLVTQVSTTQGDR